MRAIGGRRRKLAVLAAALFATGGLAYATIPDSAGVYTACRQNSNGHVRMIDPSLGDRCNNNETQFTWNQGGPTGPQGPPGDKGPTGDKGPAGDKGPVGEQGTKGETGDKGPVGDQGPAGDKGPVGDKGPAGDAGAQGPVGDKGPTGDKGPAGDKGPTGDKGPVGDKGPTGDKGPPGDPGTVGPLGQSATSVFGTAEVALTQTNPVFVPLPGLTQTITVPANGVVYVSSDGGVRCNSGQTTGSSIVDVALFVDGSPVPNGGYRRLLAVNSPNLTSVSETWSFQEALVLSPGTHTLHVSAVLIGGNSDAVASGNTNSVLQGQLTVMILRV